MVQKHLIQKYLEKTFGKNRDFVHSQTLSNEVEGVEIFGYKGALVLVKEVDNTVFFRLPQYA